MNLFDWLLGKKPQDPNVTASDPDESNLEALLGALRNPVLYLFQHQVLPEAVFHHHPELVRELEQGPSSRPLFHFQIKAHLRSSLGGGSEGDLASIEEPAEQLDRLFAGMTIQTFRRAGHTVHVVIMPPPHAMTDCHFIAIVYKNDESNNSMQPAPSTRYLTLEKSFDPNQPMLCGWTPEGTHVNYGEGPPPTLKAFVDTVFARFTNP